MLVNQNTVVPTLLLPKDGTKRLARIYDFTVECVLEDGTKTSIFITEADTDNNTVIVAYGDAEPQKKKCLQIKVGIFIDSELYIIADSLHPQYEKHFFEKLPKTEMNGESAIIVDKVALPKWYD